MAEDLGKKLKAIRESREISLEEVSQKTRIRLEYLEAIEWGEIEAIPSVVQYRGFLRLYAAELGYSLNDLEEDTGSEIQSQGQNETANFESAEESDEDALNQDVIITIEEPTTKLDSEEPVASISADEDSRQPQKDLKNKEKLKTFLTISEKIRRRRALLSLSLEDIENHTHIRIPYLIAIESGDFDVLPSPVQAKGMLANYAKFLNLDSEEILLEYAAGLQEKRNINVQSSSLNRKHEVRELSPIRLKFKNFFSIDLLFILVLFIAFAAFVIWGVNRILGAEETPTLSTEIPEISDILLATGSPTADLDLLSELTATNAQEDQTPVETLPLFTPQPNENPINIVIIPRQRVWVQITADSEVVFTGRLINGNAYDYSADDTLEILTGNAGALQIYFNDLDIGSPGLNGQVVTILFTENGQVLPTPTNTPTTTNTPQDTGTPTITPNPSITPTPTPPL